MKDTAMRYAFLIAFFGLLSTSVLALCVWEHASDCGYMAIACHNRADVGSSFGLGNYAYAMVKKQGEGILDESEVECPPPPPCDCVWDYYCPPEDCEDDDTTL